MMLDSLGVGLLGTGTDVFNKALEYSQVQRASSHEDQLLLDHLTTFCLSQMFASEDRSSVWGKADVTVPPHYAAFVNGIAVSYFKCNVK